MFSDIKPRFKKELDYSPRGFNGDQLLEVTGKSGVSPLLSRSCEVSRIIGISQNARLISHFTFDVDRSMISSFFDRNYFAVVFFSLLLLCTLFVSPAFAHHPFGIGESSGLSAWQAFLSGIGHPLLGADHLLFLLGITLVGLKRTYKWVLLLLVVGLGGSSFVQLQPLPDLLIPWAEAFVSLTLAIEGLIILNFLSSKWLLPMFALHGYLLGSTFVGVEPTPLMGYFLGLLFAQGFLLLVITSVFQRGVSKLDINFRNLLAGVWIGIGLAFSWFALNP